VRDPAEFEGRWVPSWSRLRFTCPYRLCVLGLSRPGKGEGGTLQRLDTVELSEQLVHNSIRDPGIVVSAPERHPETLSITQRYVSVTQRALSVAQETHRGAMASNSSKNSRHGAAA
jgi:hypothetical protein